MVAAERSESPAWDEISAPHVRQPPPLFPMPPGGQPPGGQEDTRGDWGYAVKVVRRKHQEEEAAPMRLAGDGADEEEEGQAFYAGRSRSRLEAENNAEI